MQIKFIIFSFISIACYDLLLATPTQVFWTNCTTVTQPQNTYHLNVQGFFNIDGGSHFPPQIGLEAGLFAYKGISAEGGVDYLAGIKHPFVFNGKIALDEDKLFAGAPSLSIGLFNVGTSHKTNQCVSDIVIGKSLPNNLGTFYAGLYTGKRALGKHRSGWMVAYQKPFQKVNEYYKWIFNADFSSNKNVLGGGGFALTYYFTPTINLETGPVWFTDTHTNGRWKWSIQLGVDV